MKGLIQQFNPVFDHRVRLALMSILAVNESADFNSLKEMLSLTDGNLASHIAALEKQQYLSVRKRFIGKKPSTSYSATAAGRKAFAQHLEALERLIRASQ